ncbi:hypothetical protein SKAU_G00171090 [Synaphobranchus kaupii]|uniref:Uncharacterized protein n=1 Tax=Synaphobranchus kaupii TaxID=118154 RepID=A0A9Q1IYK8_SYNKA|nr:hypothetical protein SKAU_G00171090 [Synaphobranchus kaupii]
MASSRSEAVKLTTGAVTVSVIHICEVYGGDRRADEVLLPLGLSSRRTGRFCQVGRLVAGTDGGGNRGACGY